MHKIIPGTLDLYITDTLEFQYEDGTPVTFPEKDNIVAIPRCGRIEKYDKKFIQLCAWFEVPVFVDWNTVRFYPVNTPQRSIPYRVVYLKPYYYGSTKLRVCPECPRYLVSEDGVTILHHNNGNKPMKFYLGNCGYYTISAYVPIISAYRDYNVHQMIASAWVLKGMDDPDKFTVNHIDGNKLNNHASNLEWCSPSYNNIDALQRNKKSKEPIGKVRNVETGEITEFKTYTEMCKFMGITGHSKLRFYRRSLNELVNGKYEVRLAGDTRPWFYLDKNIINVVKSRYIITVTEPNGVLNVFNGPLKLKEHYGIRSTIHDMQGILALFKEKFPGYIITYIDQHPKNEYQAINVQTGEERLYTSLTQAYNDFGISKDRVYALVASNGYLCANGWRIRVKSDGPWSEDYKETYNLKAIRYKFVNKATKEISYSLSLGEFGRTHGISTRSLHRMINKPHLDDLYEVSIENIT